MPIGAKVSLAHSRRRNMLDIIYLALALGAFGLLGALVAELRRL